MPQYTYRCPTCHHTETRIVRFDDRDKQTCEVKTIKDATITGVSMTERGPELDGTVNEAVVCNTPMVRDEIEETAFTPYSWKP
jgi:hypothetical protein